MTSLSSGEQSRFFKLVSQETAESKAHASGTGTAKASNKGSKTSKATAKSHKS